MKLTIQKLIFAIILLTFAACSKKEVEPEVTPKPVTVTDVYIAGNITAANNMLLAAYWKNGTLVKLSNDSTTLSSAHNIVVNGNDVYVSGHLSTTSPGIKPVYWKNGVMTILEGISGQLNDNLSIAVSGTDVYITGIRLRPFTSPTTSVSAYWKNGVPQQLQLPSGTINLDANSIAVIGNDVYVSGALGIGSIGTVAVYWKNGVPTILNPTNVPFGTYSRGIAVQGNDVYISGFNIGGTGGYWKNGVFTNLGTDHYNIYTIAAKGTDVYIGGTKSSNFGGMDYKATYWKNGVVANRVGGEAFNNPAFVSVRSIALDGDDVYAAGYLNTPQPSYWKNNALVKFSTNSTAVGVGIYIVTK